MRITTSDSKLLNELINFTILFRFTTAESLEFIQQRFRKISEACHKHRRSRLTSDKSAEQWLSQMAMSGFVQFHKQNVETIQALQNDSLEQLRIQESKKPRNEPLILKMQLNIRENTRLLTELNFGSPLLAQIKSRLSSASSSRVNPRSSIAALRELSDLVDLESSDKEELT